jgi:phage-related tail protein
MNTHPNTPLGKLFFKLGIWHPAIEDGIVAAYNKLQEEEKVAIVNASGIIAIITRNVEQTPDFIFSLITAKIPSATKEAVTDFLNHINTELKLVDSQVPATFEDALKKLQTWLSGFGGKAWASIVRAVVEVGATFLKKRLIHSNSSNGIGVCIPRVC